MMKGGGRERKKEREREKEGKKKRREREYVVGEVPHTFKPPDLLGTQSRSSLTTKGLAQAIHEASAPMIQTPPIRPHIQHWGLQFNVRFG